MLPLSKQTSRTARFPALRRLAFASGVALLVLAGCDTTSEPVVLFYTETVGFDFTSETAMMMGQVTSISGDRRIDLTEKLGREGFSKAEVLAAFVESAELDIQAPIGVSLDFLNEAVLQIEASGLSETTVATESDPPATSDPSPMDVRAGTNIGSYVAASNFGLVLQIDPAELEDAQDYELEVMVRIRVELEGV